jgi:hypothetical protein
MQRVMTGIFALVIAGIVIVLVVFVANRVGEMEEVCADGVGGVDVGGACGGGRE